VLQDDRDGGCDEVLKEQVTVLAIVCIHERITDGICREEYVFRMNTGIRGAMNGMEEWYVWRYISLFVPVVDIE